MNPFFRVTEQDVKPYGLMCLEDGCETRLDIGDVAAMAFEGIAGNGLEIAAIICIDCYYKRTGEYHANV